MSIGDEGKDVLLFAEQRIDRAGLERCRRLFKPAESRHCGWLEAYR